MVFSNRNFSGSSWPLHVIVFNIDFCSNAILNLLKRRQNKTEQGPLINNLLLHNGTVLYARIQLTKFNTCTKFSSYCFLGSFTNCFYLV